MNAARKHEKDYRAAQAITAAQISRARRRDNQPSGYTRFTPNYVPPRMHRCKSHDYMFYPQPWTDPSTGQTYNKGYYDEEGNYYEKIAFFNQNTGKYESKLVCNFCGCEVKAEWEKGSAPKCPNCAGSMEEVITGIMYDDEFEWFYMPDMTLTPDEEQQMSKEPSMTKAKPMSKGARVVTPIAVAGSLILTCCLCGGLSGCPTTSSKIVDTLNSATEKLEETSERLENQISENGYDDTYDDEIPPLYVEEIGRECNNSDREYNNCGNGSRGNKA